MDPWQLTTIALFAVLVVGSIHHFWHLRRVDRELRKLEDSAPPSELEVKCLVLAGELRDLIAAGRSYMEYHRRRIYGDDPVRLSGLHPALDHAEEVLFENGWHEPGGRIEKVHRTYGGEWLEKQRMKDERERVSTQ